LSQPRRDTADPNNNDYLGWIFQSLIINYHSSIIISKQPRATEQYFQSQKYTRFITANQPFLQKKYAPPQNPPQNHQKQRKLLIIWTFRASLYNEAAQT
jgi:hypothetical protein